MISPLSYRLQVRRLGQQGLTAGPSQGLQALLLTRAQDEAVGGRGADEGREQHGYEHLHNWGIGILYCTYNKEPPK